MVFNSFSKINLTLNVFRKKNKKKNSLHQIQSYFCLINLHDKIRINKINSQKDTIRFKGKFSKYINSKNNSVIDTLKILRKNKIISGYYSVLINKNIPVYSGLGGGTSNAAYLIQYFFKKKRLSNSLINYITDKIGSDLKLFFCTQGYVQNIKTIKKLQKKHKYYFVLVYPNIKCSTRQIYLKNKNFSNKFKNIFYHINNKKNFLDFLINNSNDLQKNVEKRYSIIKNIINDLKMFKGCQFSRITGSGSVCYGLFLNEKLAYATLNKIKLKYPNYWSLVAKTI